jgi:hypothetical protein
MMTTKTSFFTRFNYTLTLIQTSNNQSMRTKNRQISRDTKLVPGTIILFLFFSFKSSLESGNGGVRLSHHPLVDFDHSIVGSQDHMNFDIHLLLLGL